MTNNESTTSKSSYHHGDLRQSLLKAAHIMLKENGIEGLSLRKIAERVGVSRTAPYHHFKDKNALLCAIAADGFDRWKHAIEAIHNNEALSFEQRFKEFAHLYVRNAYENPDLYDLMFGRHIWKSGKSNDALQEKAYATFNQQLELVQSWQQHGVLAPNEKTLRLSQIIWSTLHGIARLIIDGIYSSDEDGSHQIKEMCDCAIRQFLISK